jgi:hypothetical protein
VFVLAFLVGLVALLAPLAADFGPILENPQAWGLILGLLTPVLVSVVQQPQLPRWARATIAVVSGFLVGTITCLINGQIGAGDLLTTIALVLVASHTAYESFFKPTGIAPTVEAATSPSVGKHVAQE